MAVLLEAVSVVVRRDAIDERCVGGWEAFSNAVPTAVFCYDSEIACVGFMAVADAETLVAHLRALGLRVDSSTGEVDVCIVEQLGRSGQPASWLGVTRLATEEIGGEVTVGYLIGTSEKRVVMPGNWKFAGSPSEKPLDFVRTDDERLKFIRSENNVDVYWDSVQECEVYSARPYGGRTTGEPQLSDKQREQHNRLFQKACAIGDEVKLFALLPPHKAGFFVARKLRRGAELMEKVTDLNPINAAAHFFRGKFLLALGQFDQALDLFAKACLIDPNNVSFAREAGICATEAGKLDVAVFYAQEALRVQPRDAGARSNLALAHLFAGNMAAAKKEVAESLAIEPDDTVTRSVSVLISEVAAGRMTRPTRARDIDHKALRAATLRG